MTRCLSILMGVSLAFAGTSNAQSLRTVHGDFVIKDFRFTSGEVLPALRLHYRTLGQPERDAKGRVRNAVLIMHGTGERARSSRPRALRVSCLSLVDCWMRVAIS